MDTYFIYKPKTKQWVKVNEEDYNKWTGKKQKI